MQSKLAAQLVALKLANPDGRLSLSTLVLIAGLVAVFAVPGWQGFSVFVVAVINHNAKRYYVFKSKEQSFSQTSQSAAEQARIDRLESEVKSLIAANNMRNLGQR